MVSTRYFAIWRGRLDLMPKSVKLTQLAIDSPSMHLSTVCLGASSRDGTRQLVTPNRQATKAIVMNISFVIRVLIFQAYQNDTTSSFFFTDYSLRFDLPKEDLTNMTQQY